MSNTPNQTQAAAAPAGRMNSIGTEQTDLSRAKVIQIQLKEVAIVVSAVLIIGGLVGSYWLYTQQEESYGQGNITFSKDAKPAVTLNAQPAINGPAAKGVLASTTIPGLAPVTKTTDSIHADIYFDFDRSRLSADGTAILQEKAAVLKKDGSSWAVLVQGYADQHGPAAYNKTLATRRAGAVKQFLVELGIPETSIKVVTLGKEGAICDDQSKECQRLNRRVHLEMMKLNLSAMALAPSPSVANAQPQSSGVGVSTSFSTDSEVAEDQDLAEQDEASVLNTETETSSTTR
ncbi:MAG: OmpA family protein [Nitrospirota bacterium]